MTADDLRREGFPEAIIEAVVAITKVKGEPYGEYLRRVSENPIARAVKIADMRHNMDLSRLGREPTEKDIARIEKYRDAVQRLDG